VVVVHLQIFTLLLITEGASVNRSSRSCHASPISSLVALSLGLTLGLASQPVPPKSHAPSYLTDCCTPISDVASRRHLRSASRRQLLVPPHNLSTCGRRAFPVAGPAAWNCLCDELREPLLSANSFRHDYDYTYLKLVCLLSTSAYSALEVLHIVR